VTLSTTKSANVFEKFIVNMVEKWSNDEEYD
jgi:hypothetical protein